MQADVDSSNHEHFVFSLFDFTDRLTG